MLLCRLDGNPCQNGSSCQYDEETDNYRCQCSEEWMGPYCEGNSLITANSRYFKH